MKIRRSGAEDVRAIERLNGRLAAAGVPWPVYAERPGDTASDSPVLSRLFVAASGDEVHGAVWLREHEFWVNGVPVRAGWAKYPVCESLIDGAFGGVPGALIFRLLREQPRLMALGMGGHGGAFARLLRGMGWIGESVPFYILPVRPARVLRRLSHLRRTRLRRAVLDALAFSGLGWAGWRAFMLARRAAWSGSPRRLTAEVVDRFDSWADAVWERSRGAYGLVARRDAAMLNTVFPPQMPVVRLRIRDGLADVGWACVVLRDFTATGETPFGALRVGLIADALADPGDARGVIAAATEHLKRAHADLLFSNQAHPAWTDALRAEGFVTGPSQFAFYRSPQMEAVLSSGAACARLHVNRGDCDGPTFQ